MGSVFSVHLISGNDYFEFSPQGPRGIRGGYGPEGPRGPDVSDVLSV